MKTKFSQENSEDGQEEPEFKVEAILRHKKFSDQILYLIKWEGYSEFENTWEPESNLIGCRELLSAYWEKVYLRDGTIPAQIPKFKIISTKKVQNEVYFLIRTSEFQYESIPSSEMKTRYPKNFFSFYENCVEFVETSQYDLYNLKENDEIIILN